MINIQLINIMLPIKQDLLRTFDHLRLMRKSVTLDHYFPGKPIFATP